MLGSLTYDEIIVEVKGGLVDKGSRGLPLMVQNLL
jgi:hypothetical protein